MGRHNRIGFILLILAVSAAACAPFLPGVAALPTQPAGAVSTYVAGTRAAAASQTAYYVTPSSTPTITRTPSRTPTITATPTATVIFKFNTFTPVKIATATKKSSSGGGSGGGGSGGGGGTNDDPSKYKCSLLSTTVKIGNTTVTGNPPSVPANTIFTVTWKVKNTGFVAWEHNSIDFAYRYGTKFHVQPLYDFPNTPAKVGVRKSVELTVQNPPMFSPSQPGKYTAHWELQVSQIHFCDLVVSIQVP